MFGAFPLSFSVIGASASRVISFFFEKGAYEVGFPCLSYKIVVCKLDVLVRMPSSGTGLDVRYGFGALEEICP